MVLSKRTHNAASMMSIVAAPTGVPHIKLNRTRPTVIGKHSQFRVFTRPVSQAPNSETRTRSHP